MQGCDTPYSRLHVSERPGWIHSPCSNLKTGKFAISSRWDIAKQFAVCGLRNASENSTEKAEVPLYLPARFSDHSTSLEIRMDSEEQTMWAMPSGHRIFSDAEWNLFLVGLQSLHRDVEIGLHHAEEPSIGHGVPAFDCLTPEQQMMVLADVAGALRWRHAPIPDHTAARESAIAAVFDAIEAQLGNELEGIVVEDNDATFVRRLICAAALDADRDEPLPDLATAAEDAWQELLDEIKERVFWDNDYLLGDQFLDLPPEEARACYDSLGIARNYFTWTPDEPKPDQLRIAERKLDELLQDRPTVVRAPS